MALYSALLPEVDAVQWFKNGDHPDDHVINNINAGRVVGRHPTYKDNNFTSAMECSTCGKAIGKHGILNLPMLSEDSRVVCPGDYIEVIKGNKNRTLGYKIWKQKNFETLYALKPKGTI